MTRRCRSLDRQWHTDCSLVASENANNRWAVNNVLSNSNDSQSASASHLLFSMAILPLRQIDLFFKTIRIAFGSLVQSNNPLVEENFEEYDYANSEISRAFPNLSGILTCQIWDHCKVIVRRAIVTILVERRSIDNLLSPSVPRKTANQLNRILDPKRHLELKDIFAIEKVIDFCRLQEEGNNREGIEFLDHIMNAFGVAPAIESEIISARRYLADFSTMHQVRNSFTHWMGLYQFKDSDYAKNSIEKLKTVYTWQVDEKNVTCFLEAATSYLVIICNRVARTLDERELVIIPTSNPPIL